MLHKDELESCYGMYKMYIKDMGNIQEDTNDHKLVSIHF